MWNKVWEFIRKKIWYIILLILTTTYVWVYRYTLFNMTFEKLTPLTLIFILWLILLILPLFTEMEILGIKLKKEITQVKADVKDGFHELKLQMYDLKVSNSLSNNIQIGALQPLASEKEISDLKQEVLKLRQTKQISSDEKIDYGVSEQSIMLFQMRLALEKLVTEICDKTDYIGHKNFPQMLRHLLLCELIDGNIFELATQIIKISNRGVHGEIVNEKYIDFVITVFPDVQHSLLNTLNKLNINVCPR